MNVWQVPGRVELVTKLWIDGKSAGEIARIVSANLPRSERLTRNAIIGKIHRLGLSDAARKVPTLGARLPKPPRVITEDSAASYWTPQDDAKLRELSTVGVSRVQAAEQIGRTPGAVRARVARLKIQWVRPTKALQQPVAWGTGQVIRGEKLQAKQAMHARESAMAKAAFSDPAPADAIPLIGRPFGRCAFPMGTPDAPADQLCCGHAVRDGSAYCEAHHRMAFRAGTAFTAREISRLASIARPKASRTLWDAARAA